MKTEDIDEAILASLKKLGPSSPSQLADDAGIDHKLLTGCGVRLRKAKLIKTAGASRSRLWALPEQKLEMADIAPPARKKTKKAKKAKAARKMHKAGARKAGKRKYTRRANGASIRAAAGKLEAKLAAQVTDSAAATPMWRITRLHAATSPLEKLRIALEEYMAVLTDMRQKLVGAPPAAGGSPTVT